MIQNIAWGLRRGIGLAVAFSIIVSLEFAVLGAAAITRIGVTLSTLLMLYLAAGLVGGLILGLGRPLGRTHAGALVLGVLVATVVYGLGVVAIYGLPSQWSGKAWFTAIVLGIGMGLAGGEKFFSEQ